jgi:hypothetical protein
MKSDAVKLELIEWLTKIEDKLLLKSLLNYKKANESLDWADSLTSDQKSMVAEGLEDIKKGRTQSSKKVWAKYGRKSSR